MSKPTFEQRCLIAEQCLPDAPYRDMLKKLHTEMLEALAAQQQQDPVAVRAAIVVNLVREGINKHRAKELADHFIGLATPQPAQRTWAELTDGEVKEIGIREHCQKHRSQT